MTVLQGLRVLLVGPLPPPAGGMANQTQQFAELLRKAGACVRVVQTNAPYRPRWVSKVPVLRALFRLVPYAWALWRDGRHVQLAHVMANSGWSWHLFASPAVRILSMRKVAVVVNYRGGEAAAFLARAGDGVRATMGRSAALVVPSGFLHAVFAEHGMSAEVVPNVVDLTLFRCGPLHDPTRPHIVVARHLEALYDNATALRAFALVRQSWPEARITLAGEGPERKSLQDLAHDLGIADAVRFAGHLDRAGMAALYASATVSVNPSTADNMPNSLLESMASGVPVVSTRVGGVPFLVEDGVTALLVPPRDPVKMASAVGRLLSDSRLHASVREAGLIAVRQYTWDNVRHRLESVYSRALARAA